MVTTITDRLYGESSGVAVKAPCVAVSNGAPLALSGLTPVGSYTPQQGDRILVKDQTDPTTNGIYNASVSGWARAGDFDGAYDCVQGTLVVVYQPTSGVSVLFQLTTLDPIIGSTPLAFAPYTAINVSNYEANVVVFGADPTGVNDSTAAIQAAINTGLRVRIPTGTYKVTNAITCAHTGQIIQGDGRFATLIKAASSFNLSALGVFVFTSGEEGPQLRDLWIDCDQSAVANAGTRANLIAYPVTIYAQSCARFSVLNVRISNFLYGIDMRGNSGGVIIDTLEMGTYTIGIQIDGALDAVRINKWHSWPFGSVPAPSGTAMTTNQQAIYNDGNNLGLSCGRCDGINITQSYWINKGIQVHFFYGTGTFPGWTFGNLTDCGFDTYGGYVQEAGQILISDTYWSVGLDTSSFWIQHKGGALDIVDCFLEAGPAVPTGPLITVSCNGTDLANTHQAAMTFQLDDCDLYAINTDVQFLSTSTTNGGGAQAFVEGNWINAIQNAVATKTQFAVTGNTLITFRNNEVIPQGSGSATLLSIGTDGVNQVTGNNFGGRALVLPSPYALTNVFGNQGVTNPATTSWTLDQGNNTVSIANGANAVLPAGSGMILVTEFASGQSAIYVCGGGGCALVSPANNWVASTTTPAAGKLSVQYNGSTGYAIYNNQGASEIVGVVSLRTRPNT